MNNDSQHKKQRAPIFGKRGWFIVMSDCEQGALEIIHHRDKPCLLSLSEVHDLAILGELTDKHYASRDGKTWEKWTQVPELIPECMLPAFEFCAS